jgi:hypothetical protein
MPPKPYRPCHDVQSINPNIQYPAPNDDCFLEKDLTSTKVLAQTHTLEHPPIANPRITNYELSCQLVAREPLCYNSDSRQGAPPWHTLSGERSEYHALWPVFCQSVGLPHCLPIGGL